MPRATMAATLLACLTLTAGCSGSDPVSAGNPDPKASSPGSEPAAAKNPLADLSAQEIWAESQKDATTAKSVHVSMRLQEGDDLLVLNVKTSAKKAFGTIRTGKSTAGVRRIGKVLYFKGNISFWKSGGDNAAAAKFAGNWIKTTKGEVKTMDSFFELTDMAYLLKEFTALEESDVENLEIIPGKSIGGQNTVAISDAPVGKETADSGAIFVAAAEQAFPMNIEIGADGKQFMKFRSWNKPVNVTAPKGAVDYDNLASLL
jgi:hypothetical protein